LLHRVYVERGHGKWMDFINELRVTVMVDDSVKEVALAVARQDDASISKK
jgi:hypothetical protein